MTIAESSRRDIFDYFEIHNLFWAGRLEETDFLSRLYTLQDMPSTDSRYDNAEQDIWQHRINNDDWPDSWIFRDSRFGLQQGSDEVFLKFLCESLHPVVRSNQDEVTLLKDSFNLILIEAGYELVSKLNVKGRSLYAAQRTSPSTNAHFNALKGNFNLADSDYIVRQITRMESAVNDDPGLAIGTAKELIESVCKTILDERGIDEYDSLDLPKLVKLTTKELKLTPPDISDSAKAVESIRRLLSNLATITNGIAELRNSYGTGHGKSAKTKGLSPRHARLAIGAASTLAVFLFETHKDR
ncbi:abortive infection family protein [Pantoea eucrina]|uniref:abortive infection family protein n=1 Tax=Pantoea eucrina TaxID=472693 RepID=UPI00301C7AD1